LSGILARLECDANQMNSVFDGFNWSRSEAKD